MNNMETYSVVKSNRWARFTLIELLCGLYFMHKALPTIGFYMPSIVYLALFAGLFLLTFGGMRLTASTFGRSQFFILLLPAVLYFIRYCLKGNISGGGMYVVAELQTILYGFIVIYYFEKFDRYAIKRLFVFVIFCYCITAITTIVGCTHYPLASRVLATTESTSNEIYKLYSSMNIGGFTFVYELVLITPIVIYLIKNKAVSKIIGFGILILFAYTIVKAEYTTALIFYVLSLVLFFIPELNGKKVIGILLIGFVLSIFASGFIGNVFSAIASNMNSVTLSSRFNYIGNLLNGNEITNTMFSGNRMVLYEKSWNAFLSTFGVGGWSRDIAGGHSFLLDLMAYFGVIGIVCFIIVSRSIYFHNIKPFKHKKIYGYILWSFILTIFLAILNPKLNYYYFIFITPLFALTFENEEDEKNG